MNASMTTLLHKLLELEKSIGVESNYVLRTRMHEVEDYALQVQKELAQNLRHANKRFWHPVMETTPLGPAA
jgi:hypothetical protein